MKYTTYLLQRYAFGVPGTEDPANAHGEKTWFAMYAVASFVYRMLLYAMIILFVAGKFFFIGVVLALWAGVNMLVMPVAKGIGFVLFSPKLRRQRRRAVFTTGSGVGLLVVLLTMLPLPLTSLAEGVLWVPEHAVVRAGTDGFVEAIVAEPDYESLLGQSYRGLRQLLLRHFDV